MALLSISQVTEVYTDGVCSRMSLFAVKNVDAGDTVEMNPWFSVIKRAGVVSDTGTTINTAAVSGTVLTMPTGPVDDAVWLVVIGVSV